MEIAVIEVLVDSGCGSGGGSFEVEHELDADEDHERVCSLSSKGW